MLWLEQPYTLSLTYKTAAHSDGPSCPRLLDNADMFGATLSFKIDTLGFRVATEVTPNLYLQASFDRFHVE